MTRSPEGSLLPKRASTAWYARFLYKNFLYGEWVRIRQEMPIVPSPEFRDRVVSVEFKEVPVKDV